MLDMRALPIFQAARNAVQQGMLGEPILISSQKSYKYGPERPWFYKERKTYGGTIPWVGIHALDYMRWVSGQEYAQVAGFEGTRRTRRPRVVRITPGCCFQLANGGTATCHLDFLRRKPLHAWGRPPSHRRERRRAGSPGNRGAGERD